MKDKILDIFFESERWKSALEKGVLKGIKHQEIRRFMSPSGRRQLLAELVRGEYKIERPHTARIQKETPGEFRTILANTDKDRIFLSIANEILFEICGDMIHKSCVSYQKGIGCGKIAVRASTEVCGCFRGENGVVGWKSDLSNYFDKVPMELIDQAFDKVEEAYGKSVIIDVLRDYYHNDAYYDSETRTEERKYQSLKQGCAVAPWLAGMILAHIDRKLNRLDGYYVRDSDDALFIGKDYEKAMELMGKELGKMNMKPGLNKVEYIARDKWFVFLGYSIRGRDISLSYDRIKTFAKEVASRTINTIRFGKTYEDSLHDVLSFLYKGDGTYSWARRCLRTINVRKDIHTLNAFVMDCLRAVKLGEDSFMADIGRLGFVTDGEDGCIVRGKGRRVATLRTQTENKLDGYLPMFCMRNAMRVGVELYDSFVREI